MCYSICITNITALEKSMFLAFEAGDDELAAKFYEDYCWWVEFAGNWIKGKI